MIPKQYRLKHKKDFEILFAEGKFLGNALVTAKVWKIDPSKFPRRAYKKEDVKIGFVVSKKVSKLAVRRNKVKRRMREATRHLLAGQEPTPGYMIALMAKPEALAASYQEVSKSIESLLRKAKILS